MPTLTVLELLRQRPGIREFTIEESVTCRVHGEDLIEKLVDGQYTSTMVDRRYVARRNAGESARGADGKIERYDYESEDADAIIEESVTCSIQGEDLVEKRVRA